MIGLKEPADTYFPFERASSKFVTKIIIGPCPGTRNHIFVQLEEENCQYLRVFGEQLHEIFAERVV